jgi:acyl-CoA reductase-like NAD-dependent aldehyde dehydrogenase
VAKIHFTGSPTAARDVLRGAAENIVPTCLELGGKSALLVCADADLLAAAQQALAGVVGLCGQGCALPTRVLVARDVQARFIVLLKGLLRRLRLGDPLAADTQVGPLVSAAARARLLAVVEQARQQGDGTLLSGGQALEGEWAEGFFMAPVLFADVKADSTLAREELFGPVLSVLTFDEEQEALRLANESVYGLAAYVFSADLRRAQRLAAALEVGSVWINGQAALQPGMPFGGCKQSGYGRLGGRAGLREFMRSKNVWLSLGDGPPAGTRP